MSNNLEIKSVIKTLKSGFWASGAGTGNVLEFEKKFKMYTNAQECVAVDSGTAALHLALNVLDVYKKEVLVPSLTFVSTVHAIMYNGGIPVFVDVTPDTLCIDPVDLENKITNKSKVILPVHFGGYPCNMKSLRKISNRNSLVIVEDAAHACGTKYNGKKIGSLSDFTCFSFHPVKNLSMPKGGAITINGKNLKLFKKRLNSLRWCGISNRKESFYDITELGFNYYMDEVSAAIGIEQLKKLDKLNKRRFDIAKKYNKEIRTLEKIPLNKECSYHLYWILVKNREKFMKEMKEMKIETGSHYIPVHTMNFYKSKQKLLVTDDIAKKIVTIPIHPKLSDKEVSYIIKTVNSLLY
jgi:dTDP-4-amino-4,6-dideoxygalactose transaminase